MSDTAKIFTDIHPRGAAEGDLLLGGPHRDDLAEPEQPRGVRGLRVRGIRHHDRHQHVEGGDGMSKRRSLFAFVRDWIEALAIFLLFELAGLMPDRKPRRRR